MNLDLNSFNFKNLQQYPNVGYNKDNELVELSFNGNSLLRPYNSKLLMSDEAQKEFLKCSNDIFYFAETYCKILTLQYGLQNIKLRDYQRKFLETIIENRFVVSSQSRRAGKTTLNSIFILHNICFKKDYIAGVTANTSKLVYDIMRTVKEMYNLLPPFLQQGIKKWNAGSIELNNGSMVKSSVFSGDSFRGSAINFLSIDECLLSDETITIKNKKTNEIKTIKIGDFHKLLENNKMNNYIKNIDYQVLTPNGFKDFKGIKKTIRTDNIRLSFNDTSNITTTPEHRLLIKFKPKIFRRVSKLKIGDKILNKKIINIEYNVSTKHNEYFDLIGVKDGNIYNTSNLISHNCAHVDEKLYEQFCDSVMPTLATADNTKIVQISTPKGKNHFSKLIQKAKSGKNDYVFFGVTWKDIDFYTKEWAEKEIKRIGPIAFNQNYNCSIIGSSKTLLNSETLATLMYKEPINNEFLYPNCNLFEEYDGKYNYVISVDSSKSLGKEDSDNDYHCINILKLSDQIHQVLRYRCNDLHYTELGEVIYNIGEAFGFPVCVIETNEGSGTYTANHLHETLGYPNVYFSPDSGGLDVGVRTTKKNKIIGLTSLKKLIEIGKMIINDADTIEEFSTFIKVGKSYKASTNATDDCIMSLCVFMYYLLDLNNDLEITIENYLHDIKIDEREDEDLDFFNGSLQREDNWLLS